MGIQADRAAVNRLLGLVDDPLAHGKHAINPNGRVSCGNVPVDVRQYKNGYAPCQLASCQHTNVTVPVTFAKLALFPDCKRMLVAGNDGKGPR